MFNLHLAICFLNTEKVFNKERKQHFNRNCHRKNALFLNADIVLK